MLRLILFSTPPNALVKSTGKYTFMDYVKVGYHYKS